MWNRKFGRNADHRKAMLRNLATSVILYGKVETTEAKAKDMIEAAEKGVLTIEKLEAMTAVCSVGLDMIIVPGDTSAETISAIIADEAAIGMINTKTTAW